MKKTFPPGNEEGASAPTLRPRFSASSPICLGPSDDPPNRIYLNRINNILVFKIKDRYKLELQAPEKD